MNPNELSAQSALLMVIDIQEKLVPAMAAGGQVIRNATVMLETAGALGIPVIITEQYPQGLGGTVSALAPWLDHAMRFTKTTFSACTADVLGHLAASERKQILVVGMETHVCVYQTVRGLAALGYEVYVLRDAVCSRSEENRLNGLELMHRAGAIITNTETVFFDLLKAAGTESFRKLRALIR
jgi:nicotinamidase-related amidase